MPHMTPALPISPKAESRIAGLYIRMNAARDTLAVVGAQIQADHIASIEAANAEIEACEAEAARIAAAARRRLIGLVVGIAPVVALFVYLINFH